MSALLSIPIASYWSIKRLALNYFPYAQQDHKLNGIGITEFNGKIKINFTLFHFNLIIYSQILPHLRIYQRRQNKADVFHLTLWP